MSTLDISSSDRITGAVLGAAIGDALGHPTEFLSLHEIRRRFGEAGVTTYELFWERDGKRFAPYTDDTQMAEVVLRGVIDARRQGWSLDLMMSAIGDGFVEWDRNPQGGHRAPGNACRAGCRALAAGIQWSEAGGAQAGGCGSVMRAYPFGLAFAEDPERAEAWAVEHSKLTHRHPIALGACASIEALARTDAAQETAGRLLMCSALTGSAVARTRARRSGRADRRLPRRAVTG